MAEEDGGEGGLHPSGRTPDTAGWTALGAASRDVADALLREQRILTRLQRERLEKEEADFAEEQRLNLSHLRLRRIGDYARIAMQLGGAVVIVLAVGALAVMAWNASHAEGIAVEAFSVPPAFTATGITGAVVADDITARISAIRDTANVNSIARSKDVRQESEEIKVEIPETGISLSQAWKYLRLWLGHEKHLSGNLRSLEGGRIALSVSLDGEAFTQEGAGNQLDALEQKAAEHVFAAVDPMNIIFYLFGQGRTADALAAAARVHQILEHGAPVQRADSYAVWAAVTRELGGDPALAMARAKIALGITAKSAGPHMEAMDSAAVLGLDEEALRQARLIAPLRRADQEPSLKGNGFDVIRARAAERQAVLEGDFKAALRNPCLLECAFATRLLRRAAYAGQLHDQPGAKDLVAQALAAGGEPAHTALPRYFLATERQDWRQAVGAARGYSKALADDNTQSPRLAALLQRIWATPLLAQALARSGDFAAAHAAMESMPADCYTCIVARGQVRAAERKWDAAQYWFGIAMRQGPSLPFAHEALGRMLLAKGDAAGAAQSFAQAHQKAPRYADALEGWGEALMAQSRSDLALAKFSQAAKLAPNWTRLHRQWALALGYVGRKDEAAKQAALADTLG